MSVRDLPIPNQMRRIAQRLSVLQLMEDADDSPQEFTQREHFWQQRGGRPVGASFLDFYSDPGLEAAFAAYGVKDALIERGFHNYYLRTTREDAFHHRLEIIAPDAKKELQIMDLRIHLTSLNVDLRLKQLYSEKVNSSKTNSSKTNLERGDSVVQAMPVMLVEWLTMQNPRLHFSELRPRLPGQRCPGTGMGRMVHSLLLIMAERLRRHAVIHIPEHFHLARLYQRAGYRFAREEKELEMAALVKSVAHLSFAAAAWAVERGCVFRKKTDGTFLPYEYKPEEMALPLSKEMKAVLAEKQGFFMGWGTKEALPKYEVDLPKLRQSLVGDPVEGLLPEKLGR